MIEIKFRFEPTILFDPNSDAITFSKIKGQQFALSAIVELINKNNGNRTTSDKWYQTAK